MLTIIPMHLPSETCDGYYWDGFIREIRAGVNGLRFKISTESSILWRYSPISLFHIVLWELCFCLYSRWKCPSLHSVLTAYRGRYKSSKEISIINMLFQRYKVCCGKPPLILYCSVRSIASTCRSRPNVGSGLRRTSLMFLPGWQLVSLI